MVFSLSGTREHARDLYIIRTYSFAHLNSYLRKLILFAYRFSNFHVTAFCVQLCYFVSLLLLGSLAMMLLKPSNPDFHPSYVDMLFMSTSALTVSGLGTVEMESLSSSQILVLTFLMLLGGEAFVGLLGLLLRRGKVNKSEAPVGTELDLVDGAAAHSISVDSIESGLESVDTERENSDGEVNDITSICVKSLGYVVLCYIFAIHVSGTLLLFIYVSLVSSARGILRTKGIDLFLFAFSTTVSSFANGGLIPTNENMAAFNRNPGLLLLIVPQILAGNTLFPLFIRLVIWASKKVTGAEAFGHLLKHSGGRVGYEGLLPLLQTSYLSLTVVGFIAAQFVLLCSLNWRTAVFDGLNSYEKLVSSLFMAVNTRHAGENSIDPSLVAPAVLVLYIMMMFLPSCTSFSPVHGNYGGDDDENKKARKRRPLVENLMLSQTSYLVVFIIIICITERRKLSRDPLNFSTLNIIFEVISGYGNVGLSTGYSCSRWLKLEPDAKCEDRPYSFSGWWSDEGKLILAFVMLYGRLKKFSAGGGRAWKLY